MKRRREHKQVWVKVNAPVDAGIAELVAELNRLPGVRTLESCGGPEVCSGIEVPGWVCFRCDERDGDDWEYAARLVLGKLGPALAKRLGEGAAVSLHVTPDGKVEGELRVRPGAYKETARALRVIRRRGVRYPRP